MIIFDLDGTLIDSSLGIFRAYNDSCSRHNILPLNINQFKHYIGGPMHEMLFRMHPSISPDIRERISQHFTNLYSQKEYFLNFSLRPNLSNFLTKFKSSNIGILTNKQTHIAIQIMDHVSLSSNFNFIAGRDFFEGSKFKSTVLNKLLLNSTIDKSSIYIGDTIEDKEMSDKAGIKFLGIKSLFSDASYDAKLFTEDLNLLYLSIQNKLV